MSDAAVATIVTGILQLATIIAGVLVLWIKQRSTEEKIDIVRKQTDGLARALAVEAKSAGFAAGVQDEKEKSPTLIDTIKVAVESVIEKKMNGGAPGNNVGS